MSGSTSSQLAMEWLFIQTQKLNRELAIHLGRGRSPEVPAGSVLVSVDSLLTGMLDTVQWVGTKNIPFNPYITVGGWDTNPAGRNIDPTQYPGMVVYNADGTANANFKGAKLTIVDGNVTEMRMIAK